MQKGRVLAVVGLGVNTFKPFTGTKTSVMFFQKWGGIAGEATLNYPIFMATSERAGKDGSGNYVILTDEFGHPINRSFERIDPLRDKTFVDHDLENIALDFKLFCDSNKIKLY